MNEPLVVKFLRDGGTIAELEARYALKAVRGKKYPNLVLLKYNQIDSPLADPLVGQCRGLVLDESDNWRVVSRSFDKFFNFGEGPAAAVDWNTARVQEKLDGSLCVIYWYDGAWQVQTSGSPDATGDVNGAGMTFAELFWATWEQHGYELPGEDHHDLCFSFELMTKYNRIVVQHAEPRLVLIGVRNRVTGDEFLVIGNTTGYGTVKMAHLTYYDFGYKVVRSFGNFNTEGMVPVQAFQFINASFAEVDPLKQEGFVVVDERFRRVKIKHPGYVAVHHLKDKGASIRRLVEVVQAGETSEFLTYFPEWTGEFTRIQVGIAKLRAELEIEYDKIKDEPDQKAFALRAVKTRLSSALFMVRSGKSASIEAFLRGMSADKLMVILGLKEKVLAATE